MSLSLLGVFRAIFDQGYPPKSKFSVEDIPDLSGKVIIVTGANSGIGKETARALLAHNARVYLACRNAEQAQAAIEELKKDTGNEGIFLHLDLSDLASVKRAADDFTSKETELHVLFNNAGVMFPHIDLLTAQGVDMTFGTNVLGHFYLTKLLLPTLLKTAKSPSNSDGKVRVVNSSSSVHMFAGWGGIDYSTLRDSPKRKKRGLKMLYCQSKLGNYQFSTELAKRYGDQGIVSTALNPGNIESPLLRTTYGFDKWYLETFVLQPLHLGPLTQLWAGTSEEGLTLNGKYLIPWARVGTGVAKGTDAQLCETLWQWCEDQVAAFESGLEDVVDASRVPATAET